MRLLHTADWHIGKIVNEFSMIEDQEVILNQLVDRVKELNVDVVIMAGDLYDRAIPPKEAVTLANHIFTRLIQEVGVPVLAIAGNHDSNERLEYAASLLETSKLYIEGTVKPEVRKVTFGDATVYLLPYGDHVTVRKVLENEEIHSIEEATKAQIQQIMDEIDPNQINILVAHGYVVNQTRDSIEESESERPLSIGAVDYVEASVFDAFDYVALGHLHKAQKVKRESIRYSGSPLKYSKSEVNHRKQSLVVDIEKDSIQVESIALVPKREMKVLRGTFEDFMQGNSEDYVFFEVENEKYVVDAMNRLRKRYPYAMGLEYIRHEKGREEKKLSKKVVQEKNVVDLFEDFYEEYKQDTLEASKKDVIQRVVETVQKERE